MKNKMTDTSKKHNWKHYLKVYIISVLVTFIAIWVLLFGITIFQAIALFKIYI
jgi:heme/copper-type cytochrome/quinol oxidase subunit 4